jgi:hypothetical protein
MRKVRPFADSVRQRDRSPSVISRPVVGLLRPLFGLTVAPLDLKTIHAGPHNVLFDVG